MFLNIAYLVHAFQLMFPVLEQPSTERIL